MKLQKIKLNKYFNKQTFIDMCTEIQVDISYFNQNTKQNSTTCHNAKKTQSI